jgi:hypothetical protein
MRYPRKISLLKDLRQGDIFGWLPFSRLHPRERVRLRQRSLAAEECEAGATGQVVKELESLLLSNSNTTYYYISVLKNVRQARKRNGGTGARERLNGPPAGDGSIR